MRDKKKYKVRNFNKQRKSESRRKKIIEKQLGKIALKL